MHLHLNPLGGLAGDMFCAALLDAFPDLLPVARDAVASVPMPVGVELTLGAAEGVLSGKRFEVRALGAAPRHRHTPFREIRTLLERSALGPGPRTRALSIFSLLAAAEARVHDTNPDEVEFHEVGAWDSIADIVTAAVLLDALEVSGASCASLPLGSGRVNSAHGQLPIPAPATVLLLEGMPVTDDGIDGERVTPTGAAILRSLEPGPAIPAGMTLARSGRGFGMRRLPNIPNCLQILCLQARRTPAGLISDQIAQLSFEVDDQNPEDLALGLDRVRAADGVLSVTTLQGIGKKGRPTMAIEVLCRPESAESLAEVCFLETTTIGLRLQRVERLTLSREQRTVAIAGGELRVKVVRRPGGATGKVEADDLVQCHGAAQRERLRASAVTAAMAQAPEATPDATPLATSKAKPQSTKAAKDG